MLLREAGYDFTIEPANINEENYASSTLPISLAMQLAGSKAEVVAGRFPNDVILAADTIVAFGDWVIGKPRDAAHARNIIELLSGTTHVVITGISVVHRSANFFRHTKVMSSVQMKNLTRAEIDRYIESNLWQGKAGGYGIQDPKPIVKCLYGDLTNVVGLPMKRVKELLKQAGIAPGT